MRESTTAAARAAIQHHSNIVSHLASCLRTKAKYPKNQAEWLTKYSEDFLRGQARGEECALEHLLSQQRCYFGFEYVRFEGDKAIRCMPDETEEWCRQYIVKG